jgi:hypothetical protein
LAITLFTIYTQATTVAYNLTNAGTGYVGAYCVNNVTNATALILASVQTQSLYYYRGTVSTGSDSAGVIYEPTTLQQFSGFITVNGTTDVSVNISGNPVVFPVAGVLSSGDWRQLCGMVDTGASSFIGEWADKGGSTPVSRFCSSNESSYLFDYAGGDQEIGELAGSYNDAHNIFFGSWVSAYVNCSATTDSGKAFYVIDSSTVPETYIGYSMDATTLYFEEYDRLNTNEPTDCTSVSFHTQLCTASTTADVVTSTGTNVESTTGTNVESTTGTNIVTGTNVTGTNAQTTTAATTSAGPTGNAFTLIASLAALSVVLF